MDNEEPLPLALPSKVWVSENSHEQISLLEDLKYEKKDQRNNKLLFIHPEHEESKQKLIVNTCKSCRDFFESITEPFGIVCVAGPMRMGKSTLLNLAIKKLRGVSGTFKWTNDSNSCTVGLWIYPKVIKLGDKNVLFVDSEGLYCIDDFNSRDEGYFVTLMILASFISSILIYNQSIPLAINMNHLKEIELFAIGLAKMKEELQSLVTRNSPTFVVLARNWNNDESIEQNGNYWKHILGTKRDFKQLLQNSIVAENSHFISLPDPSQGSAHDLSLSDELKPAFVTKLDSFIEFLEKNLDHLEISLGEYDPKYSADKLKGGSTFMDMFEKLVQAFNKSSLDMNDILNTIREGNRNQVVKTFVENFEKKCSEIKSILPTSEQELEKEWEKLVSKHGSSAVESMLNLPKPFHGQTANLSTSGEILNFLLQKVAHLLNDLKTENITQSWREWETLKEKVIEVYWNEICTGKELEQVTAKPVTEVEPKLAKLPILKDIQEKVHEGVQKRLYEKMETLKQVFEKPIRKFADKWLTIVQKYCLNQEPSELNLDISRLSEDPENCLVSQFEVFFQTLDFDISKMQPLDYKAKIIQKQSKYDKKTEKIPATLKKDKNLSKTLQIISSRINTLVSNIPEYSKARIWKQVIKAFLCPEILEHIPSDVSEIHVDIQASIKKLLGDETISFDQVQQRLNENKSTCMQTIQQRVQELQFPNSNKIAQELTNHLEEVYKFTSGLIPSPECSFRISGISYNPTQMLQASIGKLINIVHTSQVTTNLYEVALKSPEEVKKVFSLKTELETQNGIKLERLDFEYIIIKSPQIIEDFSLQTRQVLAHKKTAKVIRDKLVIESTTMYLAVLVDLSTYTQLLKSGSIIVMGDKLPVVPPRVIKLEKKNWNYVQQKLLDLRIEPLDFNEDKDYVIIKFITEKDEQGFKTIQHVTSTSLSPNIKRDDTNANANTSERFDDMEVDQVGDHIFLNRKAIKDFVAMESGYEKINWGAFVWKKDLYLEFLANYKKIAEKSPKTAYRLPQLCELRLVAQNHTLGCIKQGFFILEKGEKVEFPKLEKPNPIEYTNMLPAISITPPYPHTIVRFVQKDCVKVAIEVKDERPLLLNMANATSFGGGWSSGKAAQEEDLFRRSDYKDHLELANERKFYPIAEYGAIYTPKICFFRNEEEEGYALLPQPVFIDCIAVAAYNAKEVRDLYDDNKKEHFSTEYLVRTRRKIETIFRVAVLQKHEVLVLGALGCGAFRNPPFDVAAAFRSVIEQYAGFFKEIIFAVLKGNVSDPLPSFVEVIGGGENTKEYKKSRNEYIEYANMEICKFGAKCDARKDPPHLLASFHGPKCPFGKECHSKAALHTTLSTHMQECPNAGTCHLPEDSEHFHWFTHRDKCRDGISCKNTDHLHNQEFRHPWPICKHGMKCNLFTQRDIKHISSFRHIQDACKWGKSCRKFLDEEHMITFSHPFVTPCKYTPSCTITNPNHLEEYAHVCEWGGACKDIDDANHINNTIHIVNHNCTAKNCTSISEDHLSTFSHPGVKDIRPMCKSGGNCTHKKDDDHVKKYRHPPPSPLGVCSVLTRVLRDVDYNNGVKDSENPRITFFFNVHMLKKQVMKYLKISEFPKTDNFKEIVNFVKNARPVHRCSKDILLSICRLGCMLSLDNIKHLNSPNGIADLAMKHARLEKILSKQKEYHRIIHQYLQAVAELELVKIFQKKVVDPSAPAVAPVNEKQLKATATLQAELKEQLIIALGKSSVELMETLTQELAFHIDKLGATGVGYVVDTIVGTHRTIFSVLGPHNGNYGFIRIILNQQIMYHPDFYVVPCAATFFHSKRFNINRPWIEVKDTAWESGGKENFGQSKYHPIVPEFAKVLALELVARVVHEKGGKKNPEKVKLEQVLKYWNSQDSHNVLEGHLPGEIPTSYIEKVILTEEIWKSCSANDQALLSEMFGDKLVRTSDEPKSNLTTNETLKSTPSDRYRGLVYLLTPSNIPGSDIPVPLKAVKGKPMHIYFKAKGSSFFVCLSDESKGTKKDLFTIFIEAQQKDEVIISKELPIGHRKVTGDKSRRLIEASNFNLGLNTKEFIFYYICYNTLNGTITVDHWGPSKVYALSDPLVYKTNNLPLSIQFFSLAVWDVPVEFIDVRMEMDTTPSPFQNDSLVATPSQTPPQATQPQNLVAKGLNFARQGFSNMAKMLGKSITQNPNSNSNDDDDGDSNSKSKSATATPPKSSKSKPKDDEDDDDVNDQLPPICKWNKICKEFYSQADASPKKLTHQSQFRHSCIYGSDCFIKDKEHMKYCIHDKKPDCSEGNKCKNLQNKPHRENFRHAGHWAFLLPCKNGKVCDNKDPTHFTKYFHE